MLQAKVRTSITTTQDPMIGMVGDQIIVALVNKAKSTEVKAEYKQAVDAVIQKAEAIVSAQACVVFPCPAL